MAIVAQQKKPKQNSSIASNQCTSACLTNVPANIQAPNGQDAIELTEQELTDRKLLSLNFFNTLIRAQLIGKSALPYGLGLSAVDYKQLLTSLDDLEINQLDQQWHAGDNIQQQKKSALMATLLSMRLDECNALTALLNQHRASNALWVNFAATIVATACLNPLHLWQSLGFAQRSDLALWLALNFPSLTALNTKGMRWKRFFYLKLCEQGGDYVCRAPSCEECSSFDECFTPE